MRLLVLDLGGTNSRFALFSGPPLTLLDSVWLKSGHYTSFPEMIHDLNIRYPHFLEMDAFCAAVAGPLQNSWQVQPSNLSFKVDLRQAFPKVSPKHLFLINDFQAQAHACLTKLRQTCTLIYPGTKKISAQPPAVAEQKSDVNQEPGTETSRGASNARGKGKACSEVACTILEKEFNGKQKYSQVIIGAGSGLGMAAIIPCGTQFHVVPSEGGHAPFPFYGPQEQGFAAFLRERKKIDHPRGDDVVSGSGLALLHEFLCVEAGLPVEFLLPAEITAAPQFSLSATCQLFAGFYGRACCTLALHTLPLGGLFISGGLAAQNPALVQAAPFYAEFLNSPTLAPTLAQIPIYLNQNQNSGLWGAAHAYLCQHQQA